MNSRQDLAQKQNLHLSLKLWLPILQSSSDELVKTIENICLENPYLEIQDSKKLLSGIDNLDKKSKINIKTTKNRLDDDSFVLDFNQSFYAYMENQIENSGVFPIEASKKIAHEILNNISEDGYFDGDIFEIATLLNENPQTVEKIRQRFCLLEPCGVGAIDYKESYLFQLSNTDISESMYQLAKEMIQNFDSLEKFVDFNGYKDVLKLIKSMNNPPAIDFFEDSAAITPDIVVDWREDSLDIKINNLFGVDLVNVEADKNCEFAKDKQKEAKEICGLLNLRKTTLYNIAMIIVNKQLKFFCGGAMVPLKMQEVADMLGFNQSTISRAVSNKYIACERGIFAIKDFFTSSLGDQIAPFEIKEFVKRCIEAEDKSMPINDDDILIMVQKRFSIEIVRRTITKYRDELGYGSSKERKKFYRLCA